MKKFAILAVIGMVGSLASAAQITYTLDVYGDGTFEVYAATDQAGLAFSSVQLTGNITSLTSFFPREMLGTLGLKGFTSDDSTATKLLAAQNSSQPGSLVYGVGAWSAGDVAGDNSGYAIGPPTATVRNLPWTNTPPQGTLIGYGTWAGALGSEEHMPNFDGGGTGSYDGGLGQPWGNVFDDIGLATADTVAAASLSRNVIPEPATMLALGLGGLGLLLRRRRA